jgi:hypothetical protein
MIRRSPDDIRHFGRIKLAECSGAGCGAGHQQHALPNPDQVRRAVSIQPAAAAHHKGIRRGAVFGQTAPTT